MFCPCIFFTHLVVFWPICYQNVCKKTNTGLSQLTGFHKNHGGAPWLHQFLFCCCCCCCCCCFFYQVFFHWRFTGQQEKGEDHLDSSLPLPPAQEYSDIYLELFMWDTLPRIFNQIICKYQAATCWNLPTYWIPICSIHDGILISVCLDDQLVPIFFITVIWHRKSVDLNSRQLSSLYYKQTDQPSAIVSSVRKFWKCTLFSKFKLIFQEIRHLDLICFVIGFYGLFL